MMRLKRSLTNPSNDLLRLSMISLSLLVLSPMAPAVQAASAEQAAMNARVERLERMADNPVLIQLSRRLAEQQSEIQALNDQVDRLKYDIKNFKDQEAKRYRDNDMRLTELEGNLTSAKNTTDDEVMAAPSAAITPAPLPVTTNLAAPAKPVFAPAPSKRTATKANAQTLIKQNSIATQPATQAEKEVYQVAFDQMKNKQYPESVKSFEAFLSKYPNSSLASNAAYWAGEGYLILGDKDKALASFSVVEDSYADSSKASASLLRKADTVRDKGDKAAAKILYQKVGDLYPSSSVAGKAKERLMSLEKE